MSNNTNYFQAELINFGSDDEVFPSRVLCEVHFKQKTQIDLGVDAHTHNQCWTKYIEKQVCPQKVIMVPDISSCVNPIPVTLIISSGATVAIPHINGAFFCINHTIVSRAYVEFMLLLSELSDTNSDLSEFTDTNQKPSPKEEQIPLPFL